MVLRAFFSVVLCVIKHVYICNMEKITESTSPYRHLELMSVTELLTNINTEDQKVPLAIQGAIPQMEALVNAIVPRMQEGGRLF